MRAPRIVVTCLVIAAAPRVFAADVESARQCGSIADADARLACYDAAFGRAASAGAAIAASTPAATGASHAASTAGPSGGRSTGETSASTSDSTAAAASAATTTDAARAVEEFGLTESAKRARNPEKAKETMPESISAVVTKIGWRPTGEVVVTLDNDQVWEQAEIVTTKARVKVGDSVSIRKASLGSYTLLTATKAVVRVRRVR